MEDVKREGANNADSQLHPGLVVANIPSKHNHFHLVMHVSLALARCSNLNARFFSRAPYLSLFCRTDTLCIYSINNNGILKFHAKKIGVSIEIDYK